MRPSAVAAGEFSSAGGSKGHRTAANELPQEVTQQTVHRNHQKERARKNQTRPSHSTRREQNGSHTPQGHHKSNNGPSASSLYTKQIFREPMFARFRHQCASIRGIIG